MRGSIPSPARRARLAALAFVAGAVLTGSCTTSSAVFTESRHRVRAATPSVAASPSLAAPSGSFNPATDPVVAVVDRVEPAVVNVTTRVPGVSSFLGGSTGRAVGTGFIIRSDGIIVTNYHVVEGALNIKVTLPDGRSFTARVIGGSPEHDLAVLQVPATGLPVVPLGDSNALKLGEPVIALGYALALPGGPTVTEGIISSLARTIQATDPNGGTNGQGITRTYQDALQTDAAINPGNSGGPLVDLNGNVVGINTAGVRGAQNIGFSIAISAAKGDIEQAIAHPAAPSAYLGVVTQTNSASLASQFGLTVSTGALVVQVAPGGAAAAAGIKPGDVIVSFAGSTVRSTNELGSLILRRSPGAQVAIVVVRQDGSRSTITAVLGSRPLPQP